MPRTRKKKNPTGTPQTDISASNNLSVITSPTCKVCQSSNRHYVDIMLARGFSTRVIADHLQEAGEDISYGSVARHSKNHLNIDTGHFRRIAENHAKELTEEVAQGTFRIISSSAFLDLFIQKGWDSLIYGELDIQGRDILSAIKLKDDLSKNSISALEEEMGRQLNAIIVAIQEIVPEELQPKIASRAKEIANNELMLQQIEAPTMEASEAFKAARDAEKAQYEEVKGGENDDQPLRRGFEEDSEFNADDQSEIFESEPYGSDSQEYDERSTE